MIAWAKIKTQKNTQGFKQNPKKSLDQNLTPKKSHAKFTSHKNFQRNYAAGIRENYHKSSDSFKYPKNPYLNQATQFKNYLPNFFFPKNPEIENFKPPEKSFDHPYHLKSRVSLTGSSSTVYFLPNEQKIYRGYYTVARRYEFYFRVAKQ